MSQPMIAARRALMCLHIAVESSVADDVNAKVEAAFADLETRLAKVTQERDDARALYEANHG